MSKPQWTKCIIYNKEEILLVTQRGEEIWTLPGGGIKENESPESCINREMREELNLDLEKIEKVGEWETDYRGTEEKIYYFKSQASKDKPKINNKGLDEIKWFSIDDLPFLLGKTAKKGLELYRKNS